MDLAAFEFAEIKIFHREKIFSFIFNRHENGLSNILIGLIDLLIVSLCELIKTKRWMPFHLFLLTFNMSWTELPIYWLKKEIDTFHTKTKNSIKPIGKTIQKLLVLMLLNQTYKKNPQQYFSIRVETYAGIVYCYFFVVMCKKNRHLFAFIHIT